MARPNDRPAPAPHRQRRAHVERRLRHRLSTVRST